ncbi:MAG: hypothetical protein K5675_06085 [Lachnospiraceae bacterium]|nr:hypothetical protein [Lachnospiraceae bacterium]
MKKMMKRIVAGLLALTLLCSIIPAKQTKAASSTQSISVNTTCDYTLAYGEELVLQFTSPADGYFSVTLNKTASESSWESTYFYVKDGNGKQILTSHSVCLGETDSTGVYGTKKNKTFYVVIEDGYACQFNIRVNYTNASNWENEDNDTAKTACSLSNGKYRYGTISYGDINGSTYDYYKFKVKKNSQVKITFGPKEVTGDSNYWDLDIINSNNATQDLMYTSSVRTETVYLKKGTYYLRVGSGYYSSDDVVYKLKFKSSSLNIKKPTIKSVKVKKYKYYTNYYFDNLKMKGNKTADGFQLQIAKKKNMKGKLVNENLDITTDGSVGKKKIEYTYQLAKQKKYYVRVRGYVIDPFGNKIYGKYSKVKKS